MSILKAALRATGLGGGGSFPANDVLLNDTSAENVETTPTDSTCSISFDNAGAITYSATAPGSQTTWGTEVAGTDYEIRATVTSGSLTSGTVDTWTSLATTQSWSIARTSNIPGSDTVVFTIEIRDAEFNVMGSCSVTLTATVDSGL